MANIFKYASVIALILLAIQALPLTFKRSSREQDLRDTLEVMIETFSQKVVNDKRPYIIGRSISDERDEEPPEISVLVGSARNSLGPDFFNSDSNEKYPTCTVVAAAIAVTLLSAYIGYLLIRVIHEALVTPGRGYMVVGTDAILPGPAQKVAKPKLIMPDMPIKDCTLGAIKKGKEKISKSLAEGRPGTQKLPNIDVINQ